MVDKSMVVFYLDTCFGQDRIIHRTESFKMLSIKLMGAVAPVKLVLKIYTYLRYQWLAIFTCSSNFDCSNKVFLSIGTYHPYRELGAGKDNRLAKVFEHKAKR